MQCEFKGVISALPTPYDQSQQIDMESLRKLIRFNIEQNIKGLYVGGSTGEAFLQNVAEREKIRKRKLTAVCSHQTRIGNLDAHL
ncbi:dihydrodipicolinate synthase family protein, partial [Escherichia coli]|uniref:dihydrodipicolinate synthase family protein n=1 Tax=Escherichia coli TaxID=562 RepID=UPI000A593E15